MNIQNPPGLSALIYRVGTYSKFKQSMIASLREFPSLSGLTTRADDDLSIALFDSWAMVSDVLTFYQERIANEGFLRTAAERMSIMELARAVGYEMRPGVAANTYLAFTLEDAPGAIEKTTIDIGTKVQSLPTQGKNPPETPQIFETIQRIVAYPGFNNLKPRSTRTQVIDQTNVNELETIIFQGTETGLRAGDGLLVTTVEDDIITPLAFKTVIDARTDGAKQQTVVTILKNSKSLDNQSVLRVASGVGIKARGIISSERTQLTQIGIPEIKDIISKKMAHTQLKAVLAERRWDPKGFAKVVNVLAKHLASRGGTKVYAFRIRAGIFGHNAQSYNTLPSNMTITDVSGRTAPYPNSWEDIPINKDSTGTQYDNGKTIYLDNANPAISPNGWIVLKSKEMTCAYTINNVSERSMADFMMSAKVTCLTLDVEAITYKYIALDPSTMMADTTLQSPPASVDQQLSSFKLRETTAYVQSIELELADLQDDTPIQGDSITFDRMVDGLQLGQLIAITGQILEQPGIYSSEVVSITNIVPLSGSPPVTSIQFAPDLANIYDPATVTVNANVAPATHGESKNEVLGGGDPSQPHLEFYLKQNPLTFVAASTPSGASTTLEIRVNGNVWKDVPSLYGVNPRDNFYVTRIGYDGASRVLFGGARPAKGTENITAKYRVGIGLAGMLKAGQITLLMTRPLGVRSVTNPTAPTGAADSEDIDHARQNAPLHVLTFDRIVSLKDFENFALAFAAIGKALAACMWDGEKRIVRLIVAGVSGELIKMGSPTYRSLFDAINEFKDPPINVRIDPFKKKLFNLRGRLIVKKDRDRDLMKQAVLQKLHDGFSFEAREFGHPVTRSEVVASIQNVDGVVAAEIDYLHLSTESEGVNDILTADLAELLIINPDPQAVNFEVLA